MERDFGYANFNPNDCKMHCPDVSRVAHSIDAASGLQEMCMMSQRCEKMSRISHATPYAQRHVTATHHFNSTRQTRIPGLNGGSCS
jgi:hypothetical protein